MKNLAATVLLQLLPYVLFMAVMFAWPATSATVAVRADLTHVDSGRGFTKRELLRRMVARSRARVARLHCSNARHPGGHPGGHAGGHPGGHLGGHAGGHPGGNAGHAAVAPVVHTIASDQEPDTEYLIHFSIGTPTPQHVALTLDTGSDLVWTQCNCQDCFDQPFPWFRVTASKTFRGVLCSDPACSRSGLPLAGCTLGNNVCLYAYSYVDKSVTTGLITEDTFTFKAPNGKAGRDAVAVPSLRFGCAMFNVGVFKSNESGIAGFGRGPLSLPSQLKVGKFSYCFTATSEAKSSPVFLGAPDNLNKNAMGPIQSTPFVRGPGDTAYYLSLKGVTVGKARLPFGESAFAGSDGTIIDSGTGITNFPQAVFGHLRDAFVSQVPLPVNNGSANADSMLCFSTADPKKVAVPKLVFHLEGADWVLPREGYVMDVDDDGDGEAGLCVVINSGGDSGGTLIGNFQQRNTHIVYDLENNRMTFAPARCDKL